jgi:glucose-6-phosphate 1-dehydrogenase
MLGDPTLFAREDEVEQAWALVDRAEARWQEEKPDFPNYAAGTWGPEAADAMIQRDGRRWRRP